MTDKIQKIREEVEKLKSQLLRGACASQIAMETRCKEEAYDEVISLLDSMQEEPVSEELEEAAEEWDTKASFTPFYMTLDDKGNPNGVRQDYTTHAESFKAGAQWDKEQMMAKAIDGYVIEDIEEGNGDFLLSAEYIPKSMDLKDRQKVKVIVIRED